MSSSAGGAGAGGGGADIASLLEKAKELDQLKKDQDEVVTEINKIHKKVLACKLPSLSRCCYPTAPPIIASCSTSQR
jgi:hypothetical protein